MEYLKRKILKDGEIKKGGILKVDSFLNHQLDIECLNEIGKEFQKLFSNMDVTKILTIEASGIAVAAISAQYFKVPVVFAKKTESRNLSEVIYVSKVYSYTKDKTYNIKVSAEYLDKKDKILIIDDFLANGSAALGLLDLAEQAGAEVVGIGIVIEKSFQDGGKKLRERNINLHSLVKVEFNDKDEIIFR
ncbi:xanthine phosphoribosyltransferase [Leptotrichia sp. OH3620_COT-345]|uniref:xanthine phosphoribosyltransferase n=1 Tax=Leptotrichia sp. OH3620_COT-345 TaxID=2491048 RepID=UPI000F64E1C8|nr:xanthine phosphoribosyltransferase [Leptotrichia sp. OH3620_COT-345]RRD40644.1 xanthine phosphoribosyltransferase [Leptotrichia sp. OH3620_COT-345]